MFAFEVSSVASPAAAISATRKSRPARQSASRCSRASSASESEASQKAAWRSQNRTRASALRSGCALKGAPAVGSGSSWLVSCGRPRLVFQDVLIGTAPAGGVSEAGWAEREERRALRAARSLAAAAEARPAATSTAAPSVGARRRSSSTPPSASPLSLCGVANSELSVKEVAPGASPLISAKPQARSKAQPPPSSTRMSKASGITSCEKSFATFLSNSLVLATDM
mmetsp:Transcript_47909/g.154962  ORF Transcript_47909/g.154962 Transcript_47909/m.154962 type:complete len:226 (+) Transcript_47909:443-1120(+)